MTQEEIIQLRQRAQAMATGDPTLEEVRALVKALKKANEFGTARLMLQRLRTRAPARLTTPAEPVQALDAGQPAPRLPSVELALAQSLCTYKDTTLDTDRRYDEALAILKTLGLTRPDCCDKEILGQGGAIYKLMWENSGTLTHLHTSLAFYQAGWARDPGRDQGWCGVNAAYVLDLLAWHEQRASRLGKHDEHDAGDERDTHGDRKDPAPGQAGTWRAQARALREDLAQRLPALLAPARERGEYWAHATLAEVAFGLGHYEAARELLAQASKAGPDNWERRTTARQLISIARLHGALPAAAGGPDASTPAAAGALDALGALLGDHLDAALQGWRGKVGLALSGGGFRAALFHLGVLARLAECGVLPSVETLSTVSGGSILGAQYYLALRQLLQSKVDGHVHRDDYVQLVRGLITDTVAGVGKSLRVRALASPRANLRMVYDKGYSRSMRMGELYERYLLAPRQPAAPMQRLRDLQVSPRTADQPATPDGTPFRPAAHNWLRRAKVPNLMLNTTSLNTGHNWHFTVRWMGEPPGLTGDEIDMNERYRRVYYEDAPIPALQDYPLAYAVAASSCVPALFEPLPLRGLYEDRTVRLVDGGVHDNQGMAGLLDDGCNFILCSDASGQMDSQRDPANGLLGVFWRSNAIFQDRVREAQYRNVRNRAEGGALQGLFFIHMKQDLEAEPVDYIGSQDARPDGTPPRLTPYGVDRELQALLSELRTDLDGFTEVESFALMASGYLLARHQLRELDRQHQDSGLPGHWGGFDIDAPQATPQGPDGVAAPWPFAPLLPLLASDNAASQRRADLVEQLKAGQSMFGRSWLLIGWLRRTGLVLAGALALLAAAAVLMGLLWFARHWDRPVPLGDLQVGWALLLACLVPLLAIASLWAPALARLLPERVGKSVLLGLLIALPACVFSFIHLLVFAPLLQRRGRLARLLRLPA